MIEAAVTMAATLLSFGSVLALKHAVGLSSGSVLLAVVLALSIGRQEGARGARHRRMLLLAPVLLPLLAVAAGEISERMFTHPNLGDALFVVGMTAAIWVRRFGDVGRSAGTLLTTTLTATLIAPGPVVPIGPNSPSRWWGAVVALIALAWVLLSRYAAVRVGLLAERAAEPAVPQMRPAAAASTKMALQMAAALASAFAAGRAAFGVHWTWVVLTAFIVGSGNRGRADVTQKAILRVAGAIVGTLIATALANAFPAHDDWSVVTIFAILTIALWLRAFSYAYWAAGMTAALALLYGFYGERGSHLLLDRLEGILIGAAIGVAAAWLVLPIRNVDVIRRNLAVALAAIAGGIAAGDEAAFTAETVAVIRASTNAAELAAGSVRWLRVLPMRWQAGLPYAVASGQLASCADALATRANYTLAVSPQLRNRLSRDVALARRALAAGAGRDQVEELPVVATRIATALGSG